jgi:hypothetical protein
VGPIRSGGAGGVAASQPPFGGEDSAELVDERHGEETIVGGDVDADGTTGEYDHDPADLAAVSPQGERDLVPGAGRPVPSGAVPR